MRTCTCVLCIHVCCVRVWQINGHIEPLAHTSCDDITQFMTSTSSHPVTGSVCIVLRPPTCFPGVRGQLGSEGMHAIVMSVSSQAVGLRVDRQTSSISCIFVFLVWWAHVCVSLHGPARWQLINRTLSLLGRRRSHAHACPMTLRDRRSCPEAPIPRDV